MAVEHMDFASCERALSTCPVAVWVMDVGPMTFFWANQAALELWRARDLAQLRARRPMEGVPEKVVARSRDVAERAFAGQVVREEWTLYPMGEARTVVLEIQAVRLPDGEAGLLMYGLPMDCEMPGSILRSVAMFRHTAVIGALVAADGGLCLQNPMATRVFGSRDSWLSWLAEPSEGEVILRAAIAGESVETRLRVIVRGALRWHFVEANALRDPVTGVIGALVEHVDVSAEVEAEALADSRGETIEGLREALALVERQRQEILELSAPILDVGDHTLAVPIIGRLDEEQAEAITGRLLDAVSARRIRRVILDLTGLAGLDAGIAPRLHRMLASLRLLGATPVITGARPQLALELAQSGLELDEVATLRSLAEGLRRSRAR